MGGERGHIACSSDHRIGLAHSPDYAFFIFFRKNPRALAELTRSPRLQLSSAVAARPCEQHVAPPARQPRCRTKLPARLPCRSTELRRRTATQPSSTVAKPCSPPSPERAGVAEPRHSDTLLGAVAGPCRSHVKARAATAAEEKAAATRASHGARRYSPLAPNASASGTQTYQMIF